MSVNVCVVSNISVIGHESLCHSFHTPSEHLFIAAALSSPPLCPLATRSAPRYALTGIKEQNSPTVQSIALYYDDLCSVQVASVFFK